MKKNILCSLLCLMSFYSFSQSNEIKSVKIGEQEWMLENLNVDKFQNGDLIPEAKTAEEWGKAAEEGRPAWCYYNNDPTNGEKYGRLYNWYAVNDKRGIAPKGWYVPSQKECWALIRFLGIEKTHLSSDPISTYTASMKLRDTEGWSYNGKEYKEKELNESGFTAKPGGYRYNNNFVRLGESSSWWTSSDWTVNEAYAFKIKIEVEVSFSKKGFGYYVRCIKR